MSAEALSPEAMKLLESLPSNGQRSAHIVNRKGTVNELRKADLIDPRYAGAVSIRRSRHGDRLIAERAATLTTERNRFAAELEAALKSTERSSNTSAGELEHLRESVTNIIATIRKEAQSND